MKDLLTQGYETVKVNMLMSIAYAMNGDSLMADKFKAISFLEQLRSAGRVPKAGANYEGNMPKSSSILSLASIKTSRMGQSNNGKEEMIKAKAD